MKRTMIIVAAWYLAFFNSPALSANLTCSFFPVAVRIGILGDANVYTYACSSSQCFNLGVYNTEKTKQFYAMALAATSGGNQLVVTMYNSAAAECAVVGRSEQAFMMTINSQQ